MKNKFSFIIFNLLVISSFSQTNPIITSWLINNTGITGRHYLSGSSSILIDTSIPANVQTVQYSSTSAYISTQGIPSFVTGPFYNNPRPVAAVQNALFKFPLNPVVSTLGNVPSQATGAANIGVFINGVALYSYGDGFSYKASTSTDAPSTNGGDGVWNRNGVLAERVGFDCSKGHPDAQSRYHHHQNPSAFNMDLVVLSTVCSPYASDGLYVINPNVHSPLLGFAYDGYPIYGPYGYTNPLDVNSGITRMKSSYRERNITTRTVYANGTDVLDGPPVSTLFPIGWYREDYEYVANTDSDYLDVHNGRFCKTPQYPNGTYCYFTTVDQNYNSTYPYVVGPYFYGVKSTTNMNAPTVTPITETVLTYNPVMGNANFNFDKLNFKIYPNPAGELIIIQSSEMISENLKADLVDEQGRIIASKEFYQGSTICYFETDTIYNGIYFLKIASKDTIKTYKVILKK
jgi:hypothetical protein